MEPGHWANWAGTYRITALATAYPNDAAELAALVRSAAGEGLRVKAVGSGHSFTDAAMTSGLRVSLDRLASVGSVDPATGVVTVGAGMTLRQLNALLAAHGLALPNLGDIDAQTVSGALATGTHGTGGRLGCLSTFVIGLDLVTGSGETIHCSPTERPDVFTAAQVNVGALGVVTAVTLQCVPAFILRADERPLPLSSVLGLLEDLVAENDHFEFYWFPYTTRALTKRNNRVDASDAPLSRLRGWLDDEFLSNRVFGLACRLARTVPRVVRPLNRISARALSARVYTGASHEVFCTPRRVRFVEMEYGVPRAALPEAFAGLRRVISTLPFPVVFPVEVRFTAADDIWLSHGYGRDSAYIAIHQYVGMPYEPYFEGFERVAVELGGRPHWGKMHHLDAAALASAYPRFGDFLAVRDKLDPDRVFANAYTQRVFGE
jgi:L-gulono-1,4-lactone dehydrogenase